MTLFHFSVEFCLVRYRAELTRQTCNKWSIVRRECTRAPSSWGRRARRGRRPPPAPAAHRAPRLHPAPAMELLTAMYSMFSGSVSITHICISWFLATDVKTFCELEECTRAPPAGGVRPTALATAHGEVHQVLIYSLYVHITICMV